LKDVEVSSHHILAQSSVLVTFGQQRSFFFPKNLVELTVSNGLAIMALQLLFETEEKPVTQYISII
jgi:hypothetical protein